MMPCVETHLSNEHSEHEDAEQPVKRHEHVFYLDRRYGVITDWCGCFRRQVHAVKIAEHNRMRPCCLWQLHYVLQTVAHMSVVMHNMHNSKVK